MYESGSRLLKYRIDILDGEIKKGTLSVTGATMGMDSTAEVKGTSSFLVQDSPLMDWHKNRVKIWLIDGGIEKPLGVFLPQLVEDETAGGKTLKNVEAYDLSILAKNDCILSRLNLKAGTLYITAIQGLLISCGITKIIADYSTAVLQSDRDDWDIGTSKLTIVNQLLSEMSFNDLYIDQNGAARLTRYETPSASNIDHIYKAGQASIIEDGTTVQSNFFEIPNIWIATVSNPDLPAPLIAKYINDSPLSKTSTTYTGQRKVKVLQFDNIATQFDLQNAVNKAAFEAMQGIEEINFKTAVEAGHEINDTVALDIPEYNGICAETSWSIDLDALSMAHKGKRLVNLS